MEDFTSVVIPNRLYFGGNPFGDRMNILHASNITMIVNVMSDDECLRFTYDIDPFSLGIKKLHFPISDQNIPQDSKTFLEFIQLICHHLFSQPDEKIYVHCRGGHGRSALVCGCVLLLYPILFLKNIKKHRNRGTQIKKDYHFSNLNIVHECIRHLTNSHRSRKNINPKYMKQKCPVAHCQRAFLKTFSTEIVGSS